MLVLFCFLFRLGAARDQTPCADLGCALCRPWVRLVQTWGALCLTGAEQENCPANRSGQMSNLAQNRVGHEHCSHVHEFTFTVRKFCSEMNTLQTRRASTSSQIQKGGGAFGAAPFLAYEEVSPRRVHTVFISEQNLRTVNVNKFLTRDEMQLLYCIKILGSSDPNCYLLI